MVSWINKNINNLAWKLENWGIWPRLAHMIAAHRLRFKELINKVQIFQEGHKNWRHFYLKAETMCSNYARPARPNFSRLWTWWAWPPSQCMSEDCKKLCRNGFRIQVSLSIHLFLFHTVCRQKNKWQKSAQIDRYVPGYLKKKSIGFLNCLLLNFGWISRAG